MLFEKRVEPLQKGVALVAVLGSLQRVGMQRAKWEAPHEQAAGEASDRRQLRGRIP